jgi:hypothetical protein
MKNMKSNMQYVMTCHDNRCFLIFLNFQRNFKTRIASPPGDRCHCRTPRRNQPTMVTHNHWDSPRKFYLLLLQPATPRARFSKVRLPMVTIGRADGIWGVRGLIAPRPPQFLVKFKAKSFHQQNLHY